MEAPAAETILFRHKLEAWITERRVVIGSQEIGLDRVRWASIRSTHEPIGWPTVAIIVGFFIGILPLLAGFGFSIYLRSVGANPDELNAEPASAGTVFGLLFGVILFSWGVYKVVKRRENIIVEIHTFDASMELLRTQNRALAEQAVLVLTQLVIQRGGKPPP